MISKTWAEHGTKILGLVSGTIAAVASVSDLIPAAHMKYYMGVIAVMTFWRGYINSEVLKHNDNDRVS